MSREQATAINTIWGWLTRVGSVPTTNDHDRRVEEAFALLADAAHEALSSNGLTSIEVRREWLRNTSLQNIRALGGNSVR